MSQTVGRVRSSRAVEARSIDVQIPYFSKNISSTTIATHKHDISDVRVSSRPIVRQSTSTSSV